LLACIEAWGVTKTLEKSVGMFALALWDREERSLILARDRMGEKPLYYGWQGDSFLFGSELKALRDHPAFKSNINRDSIALLLRHNCIPAPYSIYNDIFKLQPGHIFRVSFEQDKPREDPQPQAYWRLTDIVHNGIQKPFEGDTSEAIDALEIQLCQSIRSQMLADVPLGAFLSGGIDSSTIVALMQAQSDLPVKTFTIGFSDVNYDEATNAKAVARHLSTEHTELYVSPDDALSVIPELPSIYCEPFSDSSQIPTFLISKLARQHVTVALSGDGGDEMFGGYNRYLMARRVWERMQNMPAFARRGTAAMMRALPPAAWDKVLEVLRPILPKKMRITAAGEKAQKLAGVLAVTDSHEYFRQLTSHWVDPEAVVIGASEPSTLITARDAWPDTDSFEHSMMAMDAQTYMPDDILVKVDRAAMAVSLETRVPLLDQRVVELAWRMPLHLKLQDGQGKWLLRQVLKRHVPTELVQRPKMGFAIPLDGWLRGPLRDWAEALLDEGRLRSDGYFDPEQIRKPWGEHLNGKRNWQYHLWTVLMFQAWLEQQIQR
jgi:asparagine synthase (glutamine-hydrolysing)